MLEIVIFISISNTRFYDAHMENSQPKKRGRKKKVVSPSEVEDPPQPVNVSNNISDRSNRRKLMVKMYESKASKLDKALREKNFILGIHNRMSKNRHEKIETQYEGFDKRNIRIYEKFCNSTENSDENMQWHVMISPQLIKRVCNMMEFLLTNGPMTNIEESIFQECTSILKSYYKERSILISIESASKELYRSTTYYPNKETAVYKFISEVMRIPPLNELEIYTKSSLESFD